MVLRLLRLLHSRGNSWLVVAAGVGIGRLLSSQVFQVTRKLSDHASKKFINAYRA